MEEWIMGCDSLGIEITAKDAVPIVTEWRAAHPLHSKTTSLTKKPKTRLKFSPEGFVDAILTWIAANDQV